MPHTEPAYVAHTEPEYVAHTEPTVYSAPPSLILTQADIDAIKARLAAEQAPQTAAWATFTTGGSSKVEAAMAAAPAVVNGAVTGATGAALAALDSQGKYARDVALAYVITGTESYAEKARDYLTTWAATHTPIAYIDPASKFDGSYLSHGAFMFAYAYDLTRAGAAYSDADHSAIISYFNAFLDCLLTYDAYLRTEWGITQDPHEDAYEWNAALGYQIHDRYVAQDCTMLDAVAILGLAHAAGNAGVLATYLGADLFGVESLTYHSLEPRNDGDGVEGHPVPVPQVDVWKTAYALSYMTYQARCADIMYEIAANSGYDPGDLAIIQDRLQTTWTYLARFYSAAPEAKFWSGDDSLSDSGLKVSALARFYLAYRDTGDAAFQTIAESGAEDAYYEAQYLGPVTLTHAIVST